MFDAVDATVDGGERSSLFVSSESSDGEFARGADAGVVVVVVVDIVVVSSYLIATFDLGRDGARPDCVALTFSSRLTLAVSEPDIDGVAVVAGATATRGGLGVGTFVAPPTPGPPDGGGRADADDDDDGGG
jgi:hypothetical protein